MLSFFSLQFPESFSLAANLFDLQGTKTTIPYAGRDTCGPKIHHSLRARRTSPSARTGLPVPVSIKTRLVCQTGSCTLMSFVACPETEHEAAHGVVNTVQCPLMNESHKPLASATDIPGPAVVTDGSMLCSYGNHDWDRSMHIFSCYNRAGYGKHWYCEGV
ncbi:hypothetical protein CPB85DRAFT_1021927 [Mucidula mucida]|nr:hypothetical protein CPB85DRAFT_1021927 [Mucidula mucida]